MQKKDEYNKEGMIGTILFHGVLLLLLLFLGMSSLPHEEEGLLVNFGDSETGMGIEEPAESQAEKEEKKTPPPVRAEAKPVKANKESVNTQDFEEAAALEEQKKKKEKERIEKDKKAKEAAEAKRIEDEKIRKQKEAEEAERKRQEEIKRKAAEAQNRVKNAFGGKGSGSTTSEGETQGSGNQGHVTGDPNSKNRTGSGFGNSGSGYSLSGRSLVGSLPDPEYNVQEEGIVVVEIKVDKSGKVVNAVAILKGSTTTNSYLKQKAVEAAYKAKFNSSPNAPDTQVGTINYHFILN